VTLDTDMMAAPVAVENGTKTLPRRVPKGLLPSTWTNRLITVEHVVGGAVRTTAGTLADVYPTGMILLVSGNRRTMISWECVCTVVLEAD
jgi:hypothetical protein